MACSSRFSRAAVVAGALSLAGACSQVVNVGRDSDTQGTARLNPFSSVIKYDIDPAIVLDYPRRICVGGVTVADGAEKEKKSDKEERPADTAQAAADGEAQDAGEPTVPDLVRRSLVAHALMRLAALDIAVTVVQAGDELAAAIEDCPYLLTATLLNNDEFYTLVWSRRRIGVELRLTAVDSDQTLWTARHVSSRNEASMPLDPIGLAVAVFRAQDFAEDKDIVPSMIDDVMRRLFAAFPVLPKPNKDGTEKKGPDAKTPDKTPAEKTGPAERRQIEANNAH